MRGSIAKKGARWYAVVYDGVNPETGKYIRRGVPAGTRRADAERLLADLVKRSHDGETVVSGSEHPRDAQQGAGRRASQGCRGAQCGRARRRTVAAGPPA